MRLGLDGKLVLITGGARGLGRAAARLLKGGPGAGGRRPGGRRLGRAVARDGGSDQATGRRPGRGGDGSAVSPAFVETPMTDGMMEKRGAERGETKEEAIQSFLLEERPFLRRGRRGRPEEVAPVVAPLCPELASLTVGSAYRVDGGAVGAMNL